MLLSKRNRNNKIICVVENGDERKRFRRRLHTIAPHFRSLEESTLGRIHSNSLEFQNFESQRPHSIVEFEFFFYKVDHFDIFKRKIRPFKSKFDLKKAKSALNGQLFGLKIMFFFA